jgi:hypothetical protein
MVPIRASDEQELTPSSYSSQSVVTTSTPAAESGSQAIVFTRTLLRQDARWLAAAALLYVIFVIAATLTLHAYFAQTWDVVTFVNAGKSILSPDWAGLYAQSRADRYWPYAYPPLHAFAVAPFVALAGPVPDWLMARVPPLLFDVALGVLLYIVVAQKTRARNLARLALVVWLLNPVTWYDTAVQGHFEAEWLFFVVIAYYLTPSPSPTRRGEDGLTPSPSPTRRGEDGLTPSPSPTRRGEDGLTPDPSPTRRGEDGLTPSRSPTRRGEDDLTRSSSAVRRGEEKWKWLLPTLALAMAFLFKQNAILFALPFWAMLFFNPEKKFAQRVLALFSSFLVYLFPIVLVSLPFLLYSNDYWYMNVQYVADVPLQTQSWLVALAALFSPDNLLLRASSMLTLLAAAAISFFGARRDKSLWLMALLIVLAFFLLSKKVVGYYYVMILPFALVTLIPAKHFRLITLILAAISFIFVSPYFASWANPTHWWAYALLGAANSALWLGIFVWLWIRSPRVLGEGQETNPLHSPRALEQGQETNPLHSPRVLGEGQGVRDISVRELAFLSSALFFSAAAAALVQPFINSQASPIRAPLVAPGTESVVFVSFLAFSLLVCPALAFANYFSRTLARTPPLSPGVWAFVVLLTPLYFLTFALTKESTAGLEALLKAIGM